MAVVLTGPAITVWKAESEQWKAWGSRIIETMLSTGKKTSEKTHLLSYYAPMFAALREQKEAFYDDLQAAINVVW